MNVFTTVFRHLMAKRRMLAGVLPALCLLGYSPARVSADTLPEVLIGATEGFLEFTVEDYLERSEIDARYEIRVNPLDPRLRLASCDSDLTQSLESTAPPVGRVTVKVSCEGSSPWSVFVPAQIRLYREVVVLLHPMNRESIIGEADVGLVEHDVSALNRGYLVSTELVIGRKLTRAMPAGLPLVPNNLQLAESIRKGDQVVISARSGGVAVRMPGQALANGVIGEQINVRNLGSKRVIRARVIGPGQVEVAL